MRKGASTLMDAPVPRSLTARGVSAVPVGQVVQTRKRHAK